MTILTKNTDKLREEVAAIADTFRALCAELTAWAEKTSAALADEPAVPEGKKPTRDELWELWLRLNNELPDRPAAVAEFWEHAQIDARARAAELLQRQALVPVPVSERLPRPSVKVLAHYFNGLGKERTICAIWVPAKTRSDSYGDDDFTEYDEESDTFYWPEGWYETIENWDDLGYVKVDEGEVIYWQPIPKWPAHALPLPEVGE